MHWYNVTCTCKFACNSRQLLVMIVIKRGTNKYTAGTVTCQWMEVWVYSLFSFHIRYVFVLDICILLNVISSLLQWKPMNWTFCYSIQLWCSDCAITFDIRRQVDLRTYQSSLVPQSLSTLHITSRLWCMHSCNLCLYDCKNWIFVIRQNILYHFVSEIHLRFTTLYS